MITFLRDHWWAISGVVLATFVAVTNTRRQRRDQRPSNARDLASVRIFSPQELKPYFGTYLPTMRELPRFAFFFCVLTGIAILLPWSFDLSSTLVWAAGITWAIAALVGIQMERTSLRILGPDRIALEAPLRLFSWSVPMRLVERCDLVPGRPTGRLRVHHAGGTHSLPLTRELWEALCDTTRG